MGDSAPELGARNRIGSPSTRANGWGSPAPVISFAAACPRMCGAPYAPQKMGWGGGANVMLRSWGWQIRLMMGTGGTS